MLIDLNFNGKPQRNFIHSFVSAFGALLIPMLTGNRFIPALGTSLMKYSPAWQPIHSVPVKVQPKQWA